MKSTESQSQPTPRWRAPRFDHRDRNHQSAHEQHDGGEDLPTSNHPLIPPADAPLIASDPELRELINHCRETGRFAYDSEFIGELTYFPKLCLIQVATDQRIALIDPLAPIDLRPFWQLICDGSVQKIIHAGQQDLEPVIRHLNQPPANIFDTQIAAGFIGMNYPVALAKLVHELSGARLGKSLTFSHWDQRPLSRMQLRYAANDVRFLPAVHHEIAQRLDRLGHTSWAAEECAALCDPELYRFDPDTQYLRVRGASSLAPAGLAVLRELVIWRDAAARAHDVPPRTFLKDEILIALSRTPVKSVNKLARVRGLPRPIEQAHGADIVDATARALALSPAEQPTSRSVELSPSERFRSDALWAVAQCLCIGRSIDPSLVTSRHEISTLHHHLTRSASADELRLLQGWRRHAIGDTLLDLIRNNKPVTLHWTEDTLRAVPSALP